MNLYLISQDANNEYDTFDALVVAAESEEVARNIQPSEWASEWTSVENVKVRLIGTAVEGTEAGIILASYNQG